MGLVRQLLFAAIAVPATVVGYVLAMAGLLFPRRWQVDYAVGRAWARTLVTGAGCRVRVEGAEHVIRDAAHLVVANHASYLDPPILIGWHPVPLRFVMKQELASMPFIGWYARAAGHFFVDRQRARAGHETVQTALAKLHEDRRCLIVFPEGTRSADGRLQALKTGAFELALAGRLPLQPVAVLGTYDLMPKGAWGPRRWGQVTVRIGAPIRWEDLEGSAGRRALAARVRQALLDLGVPPGADDLPPAAAPPDDPVAPSE